MAVIGGPNVVNSGLVLYLDAANTESYPGSGATWFDLSGNGNNGTITSSPTWSNTYLGSFAFNSNLIEVPPANSLVISQPTFIVGCTAATGTVFSRGSYGVFWNYGLTDVTNTGFRARNNNADLSSGILDTATGLLNLSVVYNGSACVFYRNGVNVGTDSSFYSPSNTLGTSVTGRLTIGRAYHNVTNSLVEPYSGTISYLMVYNRALSAAEIQQNYFATKSRFGL